MKVPFQTAGRSKKLSNSDVSYAQTQLNMVVVVVAVVVVVVVVIVSGNAYYVWTW